MKYDRDGDQHYDVASALIKSIRGSDVDAALHYLARMIEAGEDPRFIARRLMISASEDIGLADPNALPIAVAAAQAVAMIGFPEAAAHPQPRHHRPRPGPEVQRRDHGDRRRHGGRTQGAGRARCRRTCATGTTRAPPSSGTRRATCTRTTCPRASPPSSTPRTRIKDREYYEPTRHGAEARYADAVEWTRQAPRSQAVLSTL